MKGDQFNNLTAASHRLPGHSGLRHVLPLRHTFGGSAPFTPEQVQPQRLVRALDPREAAHKR